VKYTVIRCSTYIAALLFSAHVFAADVARPKAPDKSKLSASAIAYYLIDAKSADPKVREAACKALMADGEKNRQELVRTLSDECKRILNTVQARARALKAELKRFDMARKKMANKEITAKRAAALKMICDSKLDKDEKAQRDIRKLCDEIEKLYGQYDDGLDKTLKLCSMLVKAFRRLNGLGQTLAKYKPGFEPRRYSMRSLPSLCNNLIDAKTVKRLFKMAEHRRRVRDTAEANRKAGANMNASERAYIKLLNDYRIMMGRKPLSANPALNAAARKHSREMQTMNYFSHFSPVEGNRTFAQRVAREGYRGARSENIFKGSSAARAAFDAWRNSPMHHRNLLDAGHSDTGIGMAGNIWTNIFGKSR